MVEEAMTNPPALRPALATAPAVTFTALPFGGAVLVDGSTFAVVECGDRDAALIEELLEDRPAGTRRPDDGGERAQGAARLVAEGWLVPQVRTARSGEGGDEDEPAPEKAEGGSR
jgi:hypothetical protein